MAELLIEIYSEEIPARMQNKAAADFKKIFIEFFSKQNIKFSEDKINSYITPRRLVIVCDDLEEFQIIFAAKKIGPKIDSPLSAVEGFLKSVGLSNVDQLEKTQNQNGVYFCYNNPESKIAIAEILQKNLPQILQKMSSSWPKSMRWQANKSQANWIRPVRNVLCLFNQKIINFEFAGVASNNKTCGHLFLSNAFFAVKNFQDYQQKLADNFVILDSEIRKEIILKSIKSICAKINCSPVDDLENDNQLLNEVVGLVEYPEVLIGEIDDKFMSLPYEVLVLTVKLHQKYFCVKDQNGKLAPYFIFVSNTKTNNQNKIISDNKKVLTARLSDAKFFIEEDLKIPLIDRLEGLKNIIFHEKIGSVYDKAKRLEALNKFIAIWIAKADLLLADKLADFAKNDLITKAVAELPELQGIIGKYYAKMQGQSEELSEAIGEQYLPLSVNGNLPKTPLGISLSIADKMDTICGLFLVGEKPTSSKDPYALRRSALGIIRIIIINQIALPIRLVVEKSVNSFLPKIIKNSFSQNNELDFKSFKQETILEIMAFFIERLRFFLKDNVRARSDIVNEIFDQYLLKLKDVKKCDLNVLSGKVIFINQFILDEANSNILALYKRVANIVNIEEKKDQKQYGEKLHLMLIKNKHDRLLSKTIKHITPQVKNATKKSNFGEAFAILNKLELPLNYFFEHNVVNTEEDGLRVARLVMLARIRDLFNDIFNFSKIEIRK